MTVPTYYPLGCTEEMSEGAYQAMFAEYDAIDTPGSLNEEAGHWRCRDGRVLEIKSMSTKHLENAIRYFVRAGWSEHWKIVELREELACR